MNGDSQEPTTIPVLVSFLRGIQRELKTPSGSGELFAEGIEAIISAYSGKRPQGAFGQLFDVVKEITTPEIKP